MSHASSISKVDTHFYHDIISRGERIEIEQVLQRMGVSAHLESVIAKAEIDT